MTSANLSEELKNYLGKNEKPITSEKLRNTLLGINAVNIFKKIKSTPETVEGVETKDCCPKLTRIQRLLGFCICVGLGLFFFVAAMFFLPVIILKARKFSLLFTLGSLFLLLSFSFLYGPMKHIKHLFSKDKLIFTSLYLGTLLMTLYFAMVMHNTPWTVLFAVLQVITLFWFLLSYIPGGYLGFSFFSKMFSSPVANTLSKTLPV